MRVCGGKEVMHMCGYDYVMIENAIVIMLMMMMMNV